MLLGIKVGAQFNKCRYSGYNSIPTEKVEALLHRSLICIDSLGFVSYSCFEELPLYVDLYRVCYNKDSNSLIIIGRTNIPEVGIYLTDTSNKIDIKSPIANSSKGKTFTDSGFFEIEIKPKKGQFLFFFDDSRAFNTLRFGIGELVEPLK
jgi:hypothetical protein